MSMTLYFVLRKTKQSEAVATPSAKAKKHLRSIDTCVQLSQTYSVHVDNHIVQRETKKKKKSDINPLCPVKCCGPFGNEEERGFRITLESWKDDSRPSLAEQIYETFSWCVIHVQTRRLYKLNR